MREVLCSALLGGEPERHKMAAWAENVTIHHKEDKGIK